MSFRRVALSLLFVLVVSASARADTVRVIVDRALVWTQPSGVSIVMTQLLKDQKAEVVRRVGDWYEIVAPPGSGGGDRRTGFINASQVALEPGGSTTANESRTARGSQQRAPRTPATNAGHRIVHVDAGFRPGVTDFTRSAAAFAAVFAEEGTIATNYGKRSGFAVSGLYAQPVWNNVAVGLGLDYYLSKPHATVNAEVPHPFFFNRLRSATFETAGLSANEAAIHIPIAFTLPDIGSLKLIAFGGPSFFHLKQSIVTNVTLDDPYPHDTVAITGVTTEDRSANLFGYHAGVDLAYFFNRSTGIGGGVRYSYAKLKFKSDDASTKGTAGGVQAVVGVRLRF